MQCNCFVDSGHEVRRVGEGRAEGAVVGDVVERQDAVLAVFQPLFGRAVAADGEGPGGRADALEILVAVDPHPAGQAVVGRRVPHLLHAIGADDGKGSACSRLPFP